jgi:hypothetical protein
MMSHEVNNSVGAVSSLPNSSLTLGSGLPSEDRRELEHAPRVAIARTEQLGAASPAPATTALRVGQPRL